MTLEKIHVIICVSSEDTLQKGDYMNKNMLVGVMKTNGDTQATLSQAIGLSPQRLNAKINATNADFTANEIRMIKARYRLSGDDIDQIFFT